MTRAQPKDYQILLKTHTLTIFVTISQSQSVAQLKEEVLSALLSDDNQVDDVPSVSSIEDFEISKVVKEKGRATGEYEVLDATIQIKSIPGIVNWEILFLQFKDETGELKPVEYSQPSLNYEDEDESVPATPSIVAKGKRKAPPE